MSSATVNDSRTDVVRDDRSVGSAGNGPKRSLRSGTQAPLISPRLFRVFSAYSRWYAGRHFHAIRISRSGAIPNAAGLPLVLYLNHASWWDPLVCLTLQNALFEKRRPYAPIDAEALNKYRFFGKLGFFGVEQQSQRGAMQFIRTAGTLLRQPDTILWLTPQGRFADVRERPARFKPGLGHLPRCVERAAYVPLALEYTHWEERKAEVLCRFGPVEIAGGKAGLRAIEERDWTPHFERQLQAAQDALALEAQRRAPQDFEVLMRAGTGVGAIYDSWRALRSGWRGEKFQRGHGSL